MDLCLHFLVFYVLCFVFCVLFLCPVFTAGLLLLLLLLCFSAVLFVFDTFLFADLCMCFFVDSRLRFFVNL